MAPDLKAKLVEIQKNLCAITGVELPEDEELFDKDRIVPRAEGGVYTEDNTRAITPRAHMARHGNLRERTPLQEELKAAVDARIQILRLALKIKNQFLAYKRTTDYLADDVVEYLLEESKRLAKILRAKDKVVCEVLERVKAEDKFATILTAVPGIGPNIAATCLTYIDMSKTDHRSDLWSYAGLHVAAKDRYVKGQAGGGCKKLRTCLHTMADYQIRKAGPYSYIYYQTKARLEASDKLVDSKNTEGKWVNIPWKDTKKSHRHGAAIRAVMKAFLSDYWVVARTVAGQPVDDPWVKWKLGHTGIRTPQEHGWKY